MAESQLKKHLIIRKAVLEAQTDEKHKQVDKEAYQYALGQLKSINEVIEICEERKRY